MRHLFIRENTVEKLKNKIKESSWLGEINRAMIQYSRELLGTPKEYLEEKKGTTARTMGGKIGTLYTAWLLTEEKNYLQKAKEMFLTASKEKDFAFYYGLNGHLAVGDAALSLAVCYDFLYEYLSEEERNHAEQLLIDLADWLHTCNSTWGLPHYGVSSCNHNSVHYAGMGMCGMLFDRQEWIDHAVMREKEFLKYAADATGYITEGVGYANYGLTTAILFCEAYKTYSGVQLLDLPLTMNQFIGHTLPLPGQLLKINDHGNGGQMMPQLYLMNRYHNAAGMGLVYEYEKAKQTFFTAKDGNMGGGMVFPFVFLFADATLELKSCIEEQVPLTQKFASGRVMTRTAWEDPMAIHVSVNSGKCHHFGHNHSDKGSFTIYGLGEEFLIDVGNGCKEGRGHNIMMINGIDQLYGESEGEILKIEEEEDFLYVVCDTIRSYEYTPKSLLGISRRNILFVKKPFPFLIIRDDMQVERPIEEKQFFEFMMHTAKGNELRVLDGAVEITGQNHGNRCRLQFVYPKQVNTSISREIRTNISYNKRCCSTDQFEEAIASCSGYNPFLTTVITFAKYGEDFPVVVADGDGFDMSISVSDEREDIHVHVTRYEMKVEK